MKNPWTKKNPLMSMWLSGANSVMNRARGQATAAGKRQAAAAVTRGVGDVLGFWTKAAGAATTAKRAGSKPAKAAAAGKRSSRSR